MTICDSAIFAKVVRQLLGGRGKFVALLSNVYLDEAGTHEGARVLCMSGYLFTEENAAKFNAEMQPVFDRFKIPFYHTSEILGGKHKPGGSGKFDHLTDDDRDRLSRIFIRTIKRRSSFGFGSTVNEPEYNQMIKRYGNMPSAYGFLLHQCLIHVSAWCKTHGYNGGIAYFLEDGAKNKGDAIDHLYDNLVNTQQKKALYRFSSFSLVDKSCAPVVNSPDILSYHWYRYHERRSKGCSNPRRDLTALLRPCDMVSDWADGLMTQLEKLVREDALSKLGGFRG